MSHRTPALQELDTLTLLPLGKRLDCRSNPWDLVFKCGSFNRENTCSSWSLRPSPYWGFGGVGKEGRPELGVRLLRRPPTSLCSEPKGKGASKATACADDIPASADRELC